MATRSTNQIFETPFDTYVQTRVIGYGGSGTVVEVRNDQEEPFAVKYLSPEHVTTQKTKRFKNELSFCNQNRHRNIVTVVDSGYIKIKKKKCPFYVMPLYTGTLRELMKQGLPPDRVLPALAQVLDGVEAAHKQGIWHRDLKPENILYAAQADRFVVADFGIAHFEETYLQTSVLTKPSDRLANFQYAAPEQRDKTMGVNHRADIFALGMILNEMFTTTIPYGVLYKLIKEVAPQYGYLDALVSRMLNQSPDQRPDSIDDVKRELLVHKNTFVVRQKINELEGTVVPASEVVDPLIGDPVRVIGHDYGDGTLILKLSQAVHNDWVNAFKNIGKFEHIPGECSPSLFGFQRDSASIRIRDIKNAQTYVEFFKGYLRETTKDYQRTLVRRQQEEERCQKAQLEKQLAEQQRREFILKNVKT